MDHLLPVPMTLAPADAVRALRGRFLARPGRIGEAPVIVLTGSEVEAAEARRVLDREGEAAGFVAALVRDPTPAPARFEVCADVRQNAGLRGAA